MSVLFDENMFYFFKMNPTKMFPTLVYILSGHYTIHLIEFDFLKSTSCVMWQPKIWHSQQSESWFQLVENENEWIVFGMERKTYSKTEVWVNLRKALGHLIGQL